MNDKDYRVALMRRIERLLAIGAAALLLIFVTMLSTAGMHG
ncbi:MAG: hypothetical protein U5K76_15765 [Woeseiaceae bacterium]|nr:hypothetical protein [Woeseiaceae bacterium]